MKKKKASYLSTLFEHLFRCKIPISATMSKDWIKANGGFYTSSVPYWDKQINNQLVETYIPISKMVDIARKGVSFYVVKPEDTKIIYDNIQDYLEHASNVLGSFYDPSVYSDTINELLDLEKLAHVVFHHAKFYESHGGRENSFIRKLRASTGILSNNSMLPFMFEEKPIKKDEIQRTSMQDMFLGMIDSDQLVKEEYNPFEDI